MCHEHLTYLISLWYEVSFQVGNIAHIYFMYDNDFITRTSKVAINYTACWLYMDDVILRCKFRNTSKESMEK